MWQEKSIAFFMKNVQESGDKLLKRCKEVEQLAVFRDTWDGYNGKAWACTTALYRLAGENEAAYQERFSK